LFTIPPSAMAFFQNLVLLAKNHFCNEGARSPPRPG